MPLNRKRAEELGTIRVDVSRAIEIGEPSEVDSSGPTQEGDELCLSERELKGRALSHGTMQVSCRSGGYISLTGFH